MRFAMCFDRQAGAEHSARVRDEVRCDEQTEARVTALSIADKHQLSGLCTSAVYRRDSVPSRLKRSAVCEYLLRGGVFARDERGAVHAARTLMNPDSTRFGNELQVLRESHNFCESRARSCCAKVSFAYNRLPLACVSPAILMTPHSIRFRLRAEPQLLR
jgi:hypothetical protein